MTPLTCRTNNAVEGYHNRLRAISKDKPGFYGLLLTLQNEFDLTKHHRASIDAGTVQMRTQPKGVRDFHLRLNKLWKVLARGKIKDRRRKKRRKEKREN